MNEKIILGTAQFGTDYGISNSTGSLLINEAEKIINFSKKSNIKFIDTAINYSHSIPILNQINIDDFKVISKLPSFSKNVKSDKSDLENMIQKSTYDIGIQNYYALLLHNPEDLLTEHKDRILKLLDLVKRKNYAKKIGISIYNPNILTNILDLYPFDIVQAPLNVIDQRILNNRYLDMLKKKNIKLHARSIFLQGLLLLPENSIPSKFNHFKFFFDIWYHWLKKYSINPLEACTRYLFQNKDVDNIIVGVQSYNQLKEILNIGNTSLKDLPDLPNWPSNVEESLINPSKWEQ